MEPQVVRDSLLHLAGELDLTRGGPPVPVDDEASRRRSLYFVHSHNEHQKFLSTFDDAACWNATAAPRASSRSRRSPCRTAGWRPATAEKIADRLDAPASGGVRRATFVRAAFLTVLAVEPTAGGAGRRARRARPTRRGRAASEARPTRHGRARVDLIQALLNHNDFVTVR